MKTKKKTKSVIPKPANVNRASKIDILNWKKTPVVKGRCATEKDANLGMAAFYLPDLSCSTPYKIALPSCAIFIEEGKTKTEPVIVIQAEKTINKFGAEIIIIGFRQLNGGYGMCTLGEVKILNGPNKLFYQKKLKT